MLKRLLCLLCLTLLSACSKPAAIYSQTAYVFGTQVDIRIFGLSETQAKHHIGLIFRNFDRMHQRLHAWQKSPLTELNQAFANGKEIMIDAEMQQWLQNAQKYATHSDHLFNPATGQLIAAWGFHQDTFAANLPDASVMHKWVQAKPSLDNLVFTPTTVKSSNPAVAIDVGGIAKGWALDYAAAYLRKNQVYHALINIGGNVLALGRKDQEPWTVGLQDPRAPEPMATLQLHDGEAIGTSGDYQRYFMLEGKRYSHLIDPRSGVPAQGIMSATVIAPNSLESGTLSDVVTKPLFIGGITSASTYLHRFAIKDALMMAANGDAYLTPSMQSRIKWLRKPPHIYRLD